MLVLQREKIELEKELSSAKASDSVMENRLEEIYTALSETSAKRRGSSAGNATRKTKSKIAKKVVKKTGAKRSLKDVVLSLTKGKSLDAKQIFDAAVRQGINLVVIIL